VRKGETCGIQRDRRRKRKNLIRKSGDALIRNKPNTIFVYGFVRTKRGKATEDSHFEDHYTRGEVEGNLEESIKRAGVEFGGRSDLGMDSPQPGGEKNLNEGSEADLRGLARMGSERKTTKRGEG